MTHLFPPVPAFVGKDKGEALWWVGKDLAVRQPTVPPAITEVHLVALESSLAHQAPPEKLQVKREGLEEDGSEDTRVTEEPQCAAAPAGVKIKLQERVKLAWAASDVDENHASGIPYRPQGVSQRASLPVRPPCRTRPTIFGASSSFDAPAAFRDTPPLRQTRCTIAKKSHARLTPSFDDLE